RKVECKVSVKTHISRKGVASLRAAAHVASLLPRALRDVTQPVRRSRYPFAGAHPAALPRHDPPLAPWLSPSAAGAPAPPPGAAPRAAPSRARLARQPSPGGRAALAWLTPGCWWGPAGAGAGGSWPGADTRCERADTSPAAGASPLPTSTG